MYAASSTRALRAAVSSFRTVAASSSRCASIYTPGRGSDRRVDEIQRPPRPTSPSHFTGKPEWGDAMAGLEKTLLEVQDALRKAYVWPLPAELPTLTPPPTSWKSYEDLVVKQLPMRAKGDYRSLIVLLNKLNHISGVANLSGNYDLVEKVQTAIEPFQHTERVAAAVAREEARKRSQQEGAGIDEFGRAFAIGRRKASSARVWLVPTAQARDLFKPETAAEGEAEAAVAEPKPVATPQGEILVNHLPLPQHFQRTFDREILLRPLRVTGLLGAFNVFALVRGGGSTGQSGAVALGIARALAHVRKDVVPTLINDNALKRDARQVERKHTNLVKARKGRTWVKR